MSYKITRGIKLVVGGVIERFWGGLGGLGGSRGVKGGLLDPYRTLFAPL